MLHGIENIDKIIKKSRMDVSEDTGKVLKSFLNLVRTNILQQTSIKPLFKEKIPGDNLFFVMSNRTLYRKNPKFMYITNLVAF